MGVPVRACAACGGDPGDEDSSACAVWQQQQSPLLMVSIYAAFSQGRLGICWPQSSPFFREMKPTNTFLFFLLVFPPSQCLMAVWSWAS